MQTLYETTGSLKPTIFRQAIPVLISLKWTHSVSLIWLNVSPWKISCIPFLEVYILR
jgi:hypothetical protein